MAVPSEVDALPDRRCPECDSRFAQDRKGRGFRRLLERPLRDANGNKVPFNWGKGSRDR